MGMLEQIVSETKTMEADAIKAETDAQKAYESFVKDTNASMEEKSKEITNKSEEKAYEAFVKDTNASMEEKTRDITNKSEEKATAEADKVSEEEALAAALNEQQELMNENE